MSDWRRPDAEDAAGRIRSGGDILYLDVPGIQAITKDFERTARDVDDAARTIAQSTNGFDPADAGKAYGDQGSRLKSALQVVGAHLFGWAHCADDLGGALGRVAAGNQNVDRSTATALGNQQTVMA
jgi:hypothetical protein